MVHGNVWMEENEGRNPVFIILKIKTKENKEKHRKQKQKLPSLLFPLPCL